MVGIVNATGNSVPPVYGFPRVKFSYRFISGAPTGSLGLASKSGWMIAELFIDVLKRHHVFSGVRYNITFIFSTYFK